MDLVFVDRGCILVERKVKVILKNRGEGKFLNLEEVVVGDLVDEGGECGPLERELPQVEPAELLQDVGVLRVLDVMDRRFEGVTEVELGLFLEDGGERGFFRDLRRRLRHRLELVDIRFAERVHQLEPELQREKLPLVRGDDVVVHLLEENAVVRLVGQLVEIAIEGDDDVPVFLHVAVQHHLLVVAE